MGTLVSALGVYLSAQIDLPTGATIVVTFGGVLILMFLIHTILHHGRDARLVSSPSWITSSSCRLRRHLEDRAGSDHADRTELMSTVSKLIANEPPCSAGILSMAART